MSTTIKQKKIIEIWGPTHHEKTLGWFQKSGTGIRHKQLILEHIQLGQLREIVRRLPADTLD
jgi:hypothetical protein